MGVEITAVAIKNEFRTESVDWLLANVGDKITIEIDFQVQTYVLSSTDNTIIINNKDGLILTAGTEWITDSAARFVDFRVGDTIYLSEYNPLLAVGTFTIVEKLDDANIRINGVTGYAANTVSNRMAFSVSIPITAVNYRFNFIENAENVTFASKIDGSLQQLVAPSVDPSVAVPSAMNFTGNKSWQIGSVTIEGAGLDIGTADGVYTSKFKIIHQTFLTPFVLTAQWDDLIALIAPSYYNNGNALKAIFGIDALYDFTDPNRIQTVESTETLGNTGWFNETFNKVVTNYSVFSVVYKDSGAVVIPSIQLSTDDTTVEVIIKNTVDTPFSNNNTKFTVNICRVPDNEDDYQLNGQTIIENFFFDRALQTVGSAAVNGDNFGTDQQMIKDVTATFTSSGEIKVVFKVDMTANVLTTIGDTDERRFLIWIATQNHTLDTDDADKVALYVDADEFYENASDPTMVISSNAFLRHPFTDVDTQTQLGLFLFPNDEIVGYSRFYLDRTGRLADVISFRDVTVKVKMKNTVTLDEFDLESFNLDMSSLQVINNNQFVDFSLDRQFHIPAGEVRKTIRVRRRLDLDTGNFYFYDVIYPYLHRWEYWEALAGVNGDFFDTGEPNNGFNNFWHRYSTGLNWRLYYEIQVRAVKNGENQSYSTESPLVSNDYLSNPDWLPATIKPYDHATNILLVSGGNSYILGYAYTRIEAEFTKISAAPVLSSLRMVIWIEVYEEGGIDGSRRISSVYEYDSDTWFESTDTSKKIVLSVLGNVAKGICLIDESLIPLDKTQFKITARIYETGVAAIDNKLFQDGDSVLFQDGDNYLFQDQ